MNTTQLSFADWSTGGDTAQALVVALYGEWYRCHPRAKDYRPVSDRFLEDRQGRRYEVTPLTMIAAIYAVFTYFAARCFKAMVAAGDGDQAVLALLQEQYAAVSDKDGRLWPHPRDAYSFVLRYVKWQMSCYAGVEVPDTSLSLQGNGPSSPPTIPLGVTCRPDMALGDVLPDQWRSLLGPVLEEMERALEVAFDFEWFHTNSMATVGHGNEWADPLGRGYEILVLGG